MEKILEKLNFAVFDWRLILLRPLQFPPFKGNLFRGALGKTMKDLTCARGNSPDDECPQCILRSQCLWSRLFKGFRNGGRSDGTILGKVENAPHPFVLHLPDPHRLHCNAGEKILLTLVLVGEAVDNLPYFILAMEELGRRGVGPSRSPFKVEGISCGGIPVYDPVAQKVLSLPRISAASLLQEKAPPGGVTMQILSPLRLKREGRFQKLIRFEDLMRGLLRRLQLLSALYCGGPERVDYTPLLQLAAAIRVVDGAVSWRPLRRYNFRQEQETAMGGVTGRLAFQGDLDPFMPCLRAGETLHLGKNTTFGMGRYQLLDANLTPIPIQMTFF